MSRKILVVDDTHNMQVLLKNVLEKQNYEVALAGDGVEALLAVQEFQPDLILLDIMMPRMDGFQFISKLRHSNSVPIIMISARQQENDIVKGFELGADDYICKPFRLRELLMRIRAVMRRVGEASQDDGIISVGDVRLNYERHEVHKNGQLIETTPLEFSMLEMLMSSVGKVLRHQDISLNLMDLGFAGSESTTKIHIRNLRLKLGDEPSQPRYIESVFGVGYRFLEVDQ